MQARRRASLTMKIILQVWYLPMWGILRMPLARRPPNAPASGADTTYIDNLNTNSSLR